MTESPGAFTGTQTPGPNSKGLTRHPAKSPVGKNSLTPPPRISLKTQPRDHQDCIQFINAAQFQSYPTRINSTNICLKVAPGAKGHIEAKPSEPKSTNIHSVNQGVEAFRKLRQQVSLGQRVVRAPGMGPLTPRALPLSCRNPGP